MWDFLAQHADLLIAIATGLGGYVWHRLFTSGQVTQNATINAALSAIGALFDQYANTAQTATTLDAMRVELRGLAAVQLGKLGIYEGTAARAWLDAGVNAAIETAIATFVAKHPAAQMTATRDDRAELHAEVRASASKAG